MGARGRFRRSFVVTVVASASSVVGACGDAENGAKSPAAAGANPGGGDSSPTAGGSNAGSTSSTGGSSATSGGSSAASGSSGKPFASAGSAGAAGTTSGAGAAGTSNDPRCPASMLEAFSDTQAPECADDGLVCHLPVDCSGGREVLTVTCKARFWEAGPVGCDKPYEYCKNATGAGGHLGPSLLCEDGSWSISRYRYGVSDQGGGCPAQLPAGPCSLGDTGSNYEHCGYPCSAESQQWTVVDCVAGSGVRNWSWSADGACNGAR